MPHTTTVTPYLCTKDTASAIEFYRQAFSATETYRLNGDDGRIAHAEIKIENAVIMLSDEHPEINVLSPQTIGGSPVLLVLDVADVDAVFAQAVAAGAMVERPIEDSFGGTLRNGKVIDPFGHRWMILTYKGNAEASTTT
ncbi:MAG TPA: VOC family protein [Roseiflexaceae bacterium]|jgi:PhnB protein|nr:VOC family protein [Roseiflexaceae bacterium]